MSSHGISIHIMCVWIVEKQSDRTSPIQVSNLGNNPLLYITFRMMG